MEVAYTDVHGDRVGMRLSVAVLRGLGRLADVLGERAAAPGGVALAIDFDGDGGECGCRSAHGKRGY